MWLRNDSNILNYVKIPSYSSEYRNRSTKKGGGVGLYMKVTIKSYKIRSDIIEKGPSFEHLWVELDSKNSKDISSLMLEKTG